MYLVQFLIESDCICNAKILRIIQQLSQIFLCAPKGEGYTVRFRFYAVMTAEGFFHMAIF